MAHHRNDRIRRAWRCELASLRKAESNAFYALNGLPPKATEADKHKAKQAMHDASRAVNHCLNTRAQSKPA